MTALVFLGLGLVCALIGRILLLSAAFGVSVWWGLSVFLPFGPLLFRLSYPDLAPLSRKFRLAVLPCLLVYFVLGGPTKKSQYDKFFKQNAVPAGPAAHYGLEKVNKTVRPPTVDERRMANFRELERLATWSEALRLKKRDLLHSDVVGNQAYNAELAEYNAALAKANAEKAALAAVK